MKQLLMILLCLALCITTLAACGKNPSAEQTTASTASTDGTTEAEDDFIGEMDILVPDDSTETTGSSDTEGETEDDSSDPTENDTDKDPSKPTEDNTDNDSSKPTEGNTDNDSSKPTEGDTEKEPVQPTEDDKDEDPIQPTEDKVPSPTNERGEIQLPMIPRLIFTRLPISLCIK